MTSERKQSIDYDVIAALRADARRGVPPSSRQRVLRKLGLGTAALGATASLTKGAGALVTGAVGTQSTAALVSTLGVGIALGFVARVGLELVHAPPPPTATLQAKPSLAPSPARSIRAPSAVTTPPVAAPATAASSVVAPAPPEPSHRPAPLVAPAGASFAAREASLAPPGLAAQQALLDDARRALVRGDGASALAAIAVHRRRFSATAFAEERAALEIRALRALGRLDEARERHALFDRAFPESLFSPSLRSVTSAPDSVTEPGTTLQE